MWHIVQGLVELACILALGPGLIVLFILAVEK